ncbi:MAG: hypothetical protein IJ282_06600 [Lachnospiraceae bacterium]|nr:hypothetical protein [Lachnospiraceae bacterium]
MRDWKKIGKKLLFPPVWIIVLLTVTCMVALTEIFFNGWEMNPFAYVSYVLSFYTLTVICIFCWKVLPGFYKSAKSKMHKNKYIDRYMTDAVFKSNVGLYRSLAINLIYIVVNAVSGYIYQTYWFGIFAVYYSIIAMMRFLLVRYVIKNPIGNNYLGELKRARVCACILMTVNLALSGAVLMMVLFDRGFRYQGVLIYVIALYTFYITVTAVIDMVKYRKYKSPILSITKVIKMASALFSMLFLETAMFAQFGADTSLEVKRIMIMLTGAGISTVVVSMAIYMIVKTTKEIKELKIIGSEVENGKS